MSSKRGRGGGSYCLPRDILSTELLPRLPATSLVRFRCVSKAWRDLISEPSFIEMQLQQQLSKADIDGSGAIVIPRPGNHSSLNLLIGSQGLFHSTVVGSGNSTLKRLHFNHFPLEVTKSNYYPCLLGSCNGLICIQDYRKNVLGIWNPSIQSYRRLPHIPQRVPLSFGFGYDAMIKDYKLVRIAEFSKGGQLRLQVQVFTLGTNSWRRISDHSRCSFWGSNGLFINGFLYWKLVTNELISFDIHHEVFSGINLPEAFLFNNDPWMEIGELGGCLALVHELRTNSGVAHNLWVMKENWVKMYSINMPPTLSAKYCTPNKPIGIIRFNKKKENHVEIVYLSSDGHPFCYDLSTSQFRCFRVRGARYTRSADSIIPYVESLVSLDH
ncbi:hypothetical protein Sjap_007635 [Stephania japonica]|uniref:F-box domain-containing protein n=1 Tax=Stephania japonica TaxID=461633 RepID=A0AAP0JND0_9MAGN